MGMPMVVVATCSRHRKESWSLLPSDADTLSVKEEKELKTDHLMASMLVKPQDTI